jgi:hypothetical protein
LVHHPTHYYVSLPPIFIPALQKNVDLVLDDKSEIAFRLR